VAATGVAIGPRLGVLESRISDCEALVLGKYHGAGGPGVEGQTLVERLDGLVHRLKSLDGEGLSCLVGEGMGGQMMEVCLIQASQPIGSALEMRNFRQLEEEGGVGAEGCPLVVVGAGRGAVCRGHPPESELRRGAAGEDRTHGTLTTRQ
jgi:hypothetical protein